MNVGDKVVFLLRFSRPGVYIYPGDTGTVRHKSSGCSAFISVVDDRYNQGWMVKRFEVCTPKEYAEMADEMEQRAKNAEHVTIMQMLSDFEAWEAQGGGE